MEKKLYRDISKYSVAEFDKYIVDNWEYFNNGSGVSNCTTDIKNKYGNAKINTMHNCLGCADALVALMAKATKAEFAKRPKGHPYEYYQKMKAGAEWIMKGVSQKPVIGSQIIYGKAASSDGSSRSHIGVVVGIEGNYIYVAEDNYKAVRNYGGVQSRNGIRKEKIGAGLSKSYPVVGYVLPKYEYVTHFVLTTTDNLNMREGASVSTDKITTLPKGTKVKWTGEQKDGFYKVYSGNLKGWCSKEYLKK